jgi:hypothetical protein
VCFTGSGHSGQTGHDITIIDAVVDAGKTMQPSDVQNAVAEYLRTLIQKDGFGLHNVVQDKDGDITIFAYDSVGITGNVVVHRSSRADGRLILKVIIWDTERQPTT